MSARLKRWIALFSIILLSLVTAAVVYPKGPDITRNDEIVREIKAYLGLDLQGGAHLVYQAKLDDLAQEDRSPALDAARDTLERRVNSLGVSEPRIQTNSEGRIIIELPGVTDTNDAIEQIGKTPLLEFKEEDLNSENIEGQEEQLILLPTGNFKSTGLTGAQLKRASTEFDQQTGEPHVALQFNDEGSKLFKDITERNVGNRVAIYLDGNLVSAPVVQTAITDGQAIISGAFSTDEANDLSKRLNAGALPVPVELLSQQTIGATLGKNAFEQSLIAGIIGFLGVAIFMIVIYRLPGLLSVVALGVYALIVIALFKLIPVVMTLAGIAGFLLSIGFAVDANVLIFERLKEELRRGRNLSDAIEEGFKRAWTSVRDSNMSTILTCVILWVMGTSIVKGFALTLGIGVLVSMFSAIVVTRTFLRIIAGKHAEKRPWLFGVARESRTISEEPKRSRVNPL